MKLYIIKHRSSCINKGFFIFEILIVGLMLGFNSYAIETKQETFKIGDICRVEADYYYAGTWEKYGDNQLICNYWKYLGDEDNEERKEIERQLTFSDTDETKENTEYNDRMLEQSFINMLKKRKPQ